jgi:hypothetical protein
MCSQTSFFSRRAAKYALTHLLRRKHLPRKRIVCLMRRRQALLGMATAIGFSGCVGSFVESTPTEPTSDPSEDSSSNGRPESRGPVRGENEVDISTQVTETDSSVEYFPKNDSVRFVAARSGDSAASYSTRDFEDWAVMQCASAARDPALEHVEEELGKSVGGGVGDGEVYVSISFQLDRNGNITSRPSVEFDELVAATPRTVQVTYELEDRKQTCAIPVYAEQQVVQLL